MLERQLTASLMLFVWKTWALVFVLCSFFYFCILKWPWVCLLYSLARKRYSSIYLFWIQNRKTNRNVSFFALQNYSQSVFCFLSLCHIISVTNPNRHREKRQTQSKYFTLMPIYHTRCESIRNGLLWLCAGKIRWKCSFLLCCLCSPHTKCARHISTWYTHDNSGKIHWHRKIHEQINKDKLN